MATAAVKASKPEPSADSYIGSLISLTSKSEIRYEGVLFNINTEESSIGLRNVKSFGTEGRKKEGQQIPPSDKIYEYILFRGTDIKDLQVKSSPPAQPAAPAPIHNDPAIIQSHYSRPVAPSSLSTTLPPSDLSSHSSQLVPPRAPYQNPLPLYQPGGSLPSWGSSPPTAVNPQGLPMPMYWPGYYAPANGMPPPGASTHPSLLRPPGLTLPQFPGINPPIPSSSQGPPVIPNLPSQDSTTLPGIPPLPGANPSLTPLALPGSLSLPEIPPLLTSTALPGPTLTPNNPPEAAKLPVSSLPVSTVNVDFPADSASDKKSKGVATNISTLGKEAVHSVSEPSSSRIVPDTLKTPLVTPGQLGQMGSLKTAKDEPEVPEPMPAVTREPILPLPKPSVQKVYENQKNGAGPIHATQHAHRGRGRGRGQTFSRAAMRFTEDFDFTAMNEKFNKDEVWGHLGKGRDKEGNDAGDDADEDDFERDADDHSKLDVKPVYVKDDFFDSLSSNATAGGSKNGRIRFSEQMKIDTETFGDFPKHRGGRGGGRGFRGGGQSRGSSFGRGYGYGGRGQPR